MRQPPRRSDAYSTIFLLRLWTNATTSRCSDSGTLNFARVAAACPRNAFQSLSLIFMPRWAQEHFSAPVVHWHTCTLAQEIDQKLLPLDAVFSAVRPETTELRIVVKPRHQIVRDACD